MEKLRFINVKLMLVMLLALTGAALPARAADNVLTLDKADIPAGTTGKVLMNLANADPCYGFQADLRLPDGLTLVDAKTVGRTSKSVITSNKTPGKERVVLVSLSTPIEGNSGAVCELTLKASDSFLGGDVIVSNGKMSNGGTTDIILPESKSYISAIGTVSVSIDDIQITAGSSATVGVNMSNTGAVAGFQTDIYLPAGLTADLSSFATTGRSGDFQVMTQQHDGFVRVLMFSLSGSMFSGTSGAIFTFSLNAADDADGSAVINLRNTTASDPLAVSFAVADAQTNVTIAKPKVASVSVAPGCAILKATETMQFSATVLPANVANKEVTWSIDNSSVATVSETGLVTAVSVGTATLTVASKEDPAISATATITVAATPAASLTLNQTEATLKATETIDLEATILPETTTDKTVTWKSSDESIATVDATGKVTAVAVGKATITATAASGVSATCEVTVVETPAGEIVIDFTEMGITGDNLEMRVGDSKSIKVTVKPETTTNKTVTYESADASIATVDADGTVTAKEVGETTITIKAASGVSATLKVTVLTTDASSITLNHTTASLKATETIDLVATILPETTTDKTVTWKSSDESIATVDATGKVTAVAVGKATITATAASGVSATCEVAVVETSAGSITLNHTTASLKATETIDLVATILPETTTDKTVTWKSSDESIATVDANGKVTAVAVGKATITATAASGVTAECAVTVVETPAGKVIIDFTGMGITGDNLEMRVGDSKSIKVTVKPETTTNKTVTYESANASIATVDADGTVTAKEVGETTITIKAASGVSATLKVTVLTTDASSITLNHTTASLKATETIDLVATILPETTTDKSVTWKSSDESIATVDANGKVTAVSVGNATITATAASGVNATCEVIVVETPAGEVIIDFSEMGITGDNLELRVGDSKSIKVTVKPETTTNKAVTYESADASIATVDVDGIVTAKEVGETTITIKAASGVSATLKVAVLTTDASSITLNHTTASLKATETIDLVATILPETTTDKTVTWKSSDEAIATVDANGKVTAVAVGKATITATAASGVSATCDVTVVETPAGSITLNHTTASLKATETIDLVATILPETTTDKTVTWKSSDESIATVDATGKVTAVAVGKATITATAASGVNATCEVTVVETSAGSITLNHTTASLKATETVDLVATILPETTTDKTVTWKSSDESIATVDANGKVTAVAVGKATITATAASGVNVTCEVTVVETPAGEVIIDFSEMGITGDNLEMRVGDSKSIKVTVKPETTTNKTVTYESANASIATVDADGTVTAKEVGETTITIKAASGVSATLKVTVLTTPAASISLNLTDATVKVLQSVQLTATVAPATTTDKTVTWTSSDKSIATVDANGLVTGVYSGVVTITATAASGVEATCTVTVQPRDTDPITVTRSEETMIVMDGEEASMWVNVTGGYAPGLSYSWSLDGNSVGNAPQLKVTGKADGNKMSTRRYTVKVIDECDGVTLLDETYTFTVETWPRPASTVEIDFADGADSRKVREGSIVELTAPTPAGGYDDNWTYQWYLDGTEVSTDQDLTRTMTMADGTSKETTEAMFTVTATNAGPDGTVWGEATSAPFTVTVYRRPLTPKQLLRKGDGTTHTLVAMSQLSDNELASLGYTFVYGYTDALGEDHISGTTSKRYCRIDEQVFNNGTIDKWCYAQWTYDDGSIVTSGKRYLDGTADEDFDGSDFSGNAASKALDFTNPSNWIRSRADGGISITVEAAGDTRISVYSISGMVIESVTVPADSYMSFDLGVDRLQPGIYVVTVESAENSVTKKIVIK